MAEVIGGDSWERLVKKYIFDPLGMTSSSFMTTYDNNMVELAKGYVDYFF
jgi:CubicO group peptidase (beta-lactamase class C family)